MRDPYLIGNPVAPMMKFQPCRKRPMAAPEILLVKYVVGRQQRTQSGATKPSEAWGLA